MRYLRAGSGHAIVLLHGLLGYSFSWRFTIPFLAQHATVYAVDMLGAGFSDRVPGLDCRLPSLADRLLHFLDVIGVSHFDLVATSHGGAIAILVAAACADDSSSSRRLRRLILAAPVNPWSSHGRLWAPFLASPAGSFLVLHGVARMPVVYDYVLRRLYGDARRIAPGTLEGYSAPYKIPGSFEYSLSVTRCWIAGLQELESALPKVADYPTLLIWGSRDRAVDPRSAVPLRKMFKHCEVVIFAGVGHLPYEEVPEEFNRVVLKFLQSPAHEF
jgi:pimeloyl-ACP methyl ester carboxylesterase